ncbi:MAG: subclass B3 metallo-beta-lactamase [Mucilaginibacter sp.]
MHTSKKLPGFILTFFLVFSGYFCTAQKLAPLPMMDPSWVKPTEPFRIAGNLYYVGTYDLACYLITTPKGHILINTGLAESATMIRANVEALGFKFRDIKILLATHAHFDHVAAMAEIKKVTGAKLMVNENDAQLLADGGNSDFTFGGKGPVFQPVKVTKLLQEHDTIKFGGMEIIPLHHPGHTKGACSFLFDVKDEHRTYRVLIANMPSINNGVILSGMPGYPDIGKDYARTFEAMKNLHFDIWLASHANHFRLHNKRRPGDSYDPEIFIDQKGYDTALANWYADYLKKLVDK